MNKLEVEARRVLSSIEELVSLLQRTHAAEVQQRNVDSDSDVVALVGSVADYIEGGGVAAPPSADNNDNRSVSDSNATERAVLSRVYRTLTQTDGAPDHAPVSSRADSGHAASDCALGSASSLQQKALVDMRSLGRRRAAEALLESIMQ